jgi:TRAP-type C4-dicarboxylate transport system substrate-binding protein
MDQSDGDESRTSRRSGTSQNAVYFSATSSDSYQLFTKFPVKSLADLKGKRILAAGAVGAWMEGLGATFVNAGIPNFYNLLQTGVGDGVVLIPSGAVPIKLHEVAPHVTYANLGAVVFGAFAANKKRWESLPQEVRDTMLPIARGYAADQHRHRAAAREGGPRAHEEGGAQISTLPADERLRWADAMPNLAKNWVDAAGEARPSGPADHARLHGG